jgi:hypothetical protein
MTKNKNAKQGHHGTDIIEDRGMRYGTPVQEVRMSGCESGDRFGYRSGKVGNIEDSINETKRR